MRKLFIYLFLSLTAACSQPANPGATPSPNKNENSHFNSKEALVYYINCIREKVPAAAGGLNIHIVIINSMSEEQFKNSAANYKAILSAYESVGC